MQSRRGPLRAGAKGRRPVLPHRPVPPWRWRWREEREIRERDGVALEGEVESGAKEVTQELATSNPVGEKPNDWKSVFNLTLTLASKHFFG